MKTGFFWAMLILLISQQVQARPPKLSGNYEAGSRYALPYDEIDYPTWWFEEIEEVDQEAWAYDFRKGYLQISQDIRKGLRYAFKYNFIKKDFFAAQTNNRNLIDYYRAYSWIDLPYDLRIKMEYYIRRQDYSFRPWDNLTHVPNVLLRWKPGKNRSADISFKLKMQRYGTESETWKDKNQVDSCVGFEERISEALSVNAKYRYTFRHYTENTEEKNAVRRSLSAGFEYQF